MASLFRNNPELVKEWHPTQNASLTPADLTLGSNKKVWWICTQGHEWQARVTDRNYRKTGCPYCYCLYTINPNLAREWHPVENGRLTPRDVTPGSSKRVWWECDKGHAWEAYIHSRSRGYGRCPYCKSRQGA
jgi:hypothetical protein